MILFIIELIAIILYLSIYPFFILCRLKSCELLISGLDDAKQMVSDYEQTLASHDNMTSDLSALHSKHRDLAVSSKFQWFWGQLSRVVKASDLGAEGPRFEPWQQHLVQLS